MPLKVEVWDEDVTFDQLIGQVLIPLNDLITDFGKWSVDGSYPLEPVEFKHSTANESSENLGEIYIQMKWQDEKDQGPQDPPPVPKENLAAELAEGNVKIAGKLHIRVVQAKNLCIPSGKTIDAIARIKYKDDIHEVDICETNTINKILNPIWDNGANPKTFIKEFEIKKKVKNFLYFSNKSNKIECHLEFSECHSL